MSDNRTTTWAGQIQTLFLDSFKADPLPQTPLYAMSNQNLLPLEKGRNTFRIYTRPWMRMDEESLATFRARGSNTNPLTTNTTNGGQIVSKALPNKYEDVTLDTVLTLAYDIEKTAGVDSLFNQPEQIAARARQVYQDAYLLAQQEECAREAIFADDWIVPSTATSVTSGAITAGDTTFKMADAQVTATGITAGDFVKIGARKTPNATDGQVETIDVVQIKTVGAAGSAGGSDTTITIEDTASKIAPASNYLTGNLFKKISIVMAAHSSGVRIQIDRPTSVNVNSLDALIGRIRYTALARGIDPNKFTLYMTPELQEMLIGTNTSGQRSPFLAQHFLGEGVLKDGVIEGSYRGMRVVADGNAIRRVYGGGTAGTAVTLAAERHYIFAFEAGESFAYKNILNSMAFERIPGTADLLYKMTWAHIHGAVMPRAGSIRSILAPVTLA